MAHPFGSEVESLERAIVAAVAPPELREWQGWIAAFDDGTVSRARSAAPLSHSNIDAAAVAPLAAAYRERGSTPMFRVPIEVPPDVERALSTERLVPDQPTDVQVALADDVVGRTLGDAVEISTETDEAWRAVFLGEGFDPVDGASRVRTLTRAPGSLFASIRHGEIVVAAGVLALGHGWGSIHGMRTAKPYRGQGLARQILSALAGRARALGFPRLMLQVERANDTAQSLYARCGFQRAWTYHYWREARRSGA